MPSLPRLLSSLVFGLGGFLPFPTWAAPGALNLAGLARLELTGAGSAALAVDGNVGTVATSAAATNAYWEAELPIPYRLTRIEVVNPSTGDPARLAGLVARVEDIRDQVVFSATLTNPGAGGTWSVDLPADLRGRILRVGLENDQPNGAGTFEVALAEVRWIGEPVYVADPPASSDPWVISQSTNHGAYPPENAVDHLTNNFTHTDTTTPNNYWQIAYAADQTFTRVQIFNRTDCCGERLANLVIRILDAGGNSVASHTIVGPTTNGQVILWTPPPGTVGRTLRVGLENGQTNGGGNYVVSLAEIRINDSGVYQSTPWPPGDSFPARLALDGNASNFTHTNETSPNNYWLHTFLGDRPIDRLELYNRTSCCGNRLANLTVRILDGGSNTVASTVIPAPTTDGQVFVFDPPGVVTGRSVRIGLEGGVFNGGGNYTVTLAEVRVLEQAPNPASGNLALNQPSYYTRHTDSLNPAANGNDGNPATEVQSDPRTVDAYWEVDLGQEFALYQVTATVPAGFNFKMNKTTLRLYDENHDSVYSRRLSSPDLVFATLTDGPRRARYVRIGLEDKVRTSTTGGTEWHIGFREVEVFGRPLDEVGLLDFAASVTNLISGGAADLLWQVEDVRELHLFPGLGSVGGHTATNGYGTLTVAPTASTEYVLVATNGCGLSFHAVTLVVDGQELPPQITEFLASNEYGLRDGDNNASDWIEIHNPRNTPLNLAGYGLSDDSALPFKWTFPSVEIAPHGFLVVFASGRATSPDPAGNLHASFSLAAGGESVVLTAPGGVTADAVLAFPGQATDLAYGRTLEGEWRFLEPTPGQFNHATSYLGWLIEPQFSEARGYRQSPFSLTLYHPDPAAQILYSQNGALPATPYGSALSVTSTRSVRATAVRPGFKSPRVQTHTYIFVDDVITAPTMNTAITQNPAYTTRLRDGLTDLLTLSVNIPETLAYPEQEGSVEILWPDTGEHLHANCGVMRFANAWTDFAKRSLRLKFRSQYGLSKLRAPLFAGHQRGPFPAIEEFDELDVRSGSQDMSQRGFYMAAPFADDSMNEMGSINPSGRFVNLYLNGAYYGKFHLRERLVDRFLADHLGGSVEDYLTVRGNDNVDSSFINGVPEPVSRASWERVRSLATDYAAVAPYLDVAHLTDFMLLWLYGNSETEYRAAGPVDAGSGFKFYLSDPDGFLRATSANNTGNGGPAQLFARLRAGNHPDFRILVADRIYKHFFHDGALTPARMTARLRSRMDEIYNALVAECARWNFRTPANWQQAATDIESTLFAGRTSQLFGYLRGAGLYPPATHDTPEFNQHGGAVESGFVPVLTAPAGTIYYTLDGSDPRLPGGAVAPTALIWTPGDLSISEDTRIRVRLHAGGEWSALNDVTFTVGTRVPAAADNTLITELHYNPEGTDGGEFIEVWNFSTNRVDYSGVALTAGVTYTFPDGFTLPAGGFALVVENPTLFATWYQAPGLPWHFPGLSVLGPYAGKLDNMGEALTLTASNLLPIASFTYDDGGEWPSRADGGGSSLELKEPAAQPTDPAARTAALSTPAVWRSSRLRHGSPGRFDTAERTLVIHEVSAAPGTGADWIELHNRAGTAADLSGLHLTNDDLQPFRFTFPAATEIPAYGFRVVSAAELGFDLSHLGGDLRLLQSSGGEVTRFLDTVDTAPPAPGETHGRHTRSDGEVDFTELRAPTPGAENALPRVGPVVMSEIMVKPAAAAFEYIELVNLSAAPVDLYSATHPSRTWELADGITFAFPTGITLGPGGVLLVTGGDPALFRAQHGIPLSIPVLGPWTGSLNNAGEAAKLLRPGAPEPDEFLPSHRADHLTYGADSPWPTPPVDGGQALERVPLHAYGNDPAHWRLSSPGGTPGILPANHPPSVHAEGNTTIPAGSPLAVRLVAVDLDAPWQSHEISVLNPPSGATFNPADGTFTWTPPEDLSPQVVSLQVRVTDDGLPPLSATNTVSLTVIEPFRLLPRVGGGSEFQVPVQPGQAYRVEYTDALLPPDWRLLWEVEEAEDDRLEVSDPGAPGRDRRYYRVLWLR
jgi:hypothetical protein